MYLVRGLPLLMFIFWAYFFVPLIIGRPVAGTTTMVVALVCYESAYLAEIIRAGIQALPPGQQEAGRALGLSYLQTMRRVILPQALYNMLQMCIRDRSRRRTRFYGVDQAVLRFNLPGSKAWPVRQTP